MYLKIEYIFKMYRTADNFWETETLESPSIVKQTTEYQSVTYLGS